MNNDFKNIQPYKRWSEYTEEELEVLPKLPEHIVEQKNVPWMWMGNRWEFILHD